MSITIEELKTLVYRDRCIFLNTKQPCLTDKIGTNGCKECADKIIDELVEKIRSDERRKILDKVSEKLKARVMICANCETIGCDTVYFEPMCEKAKPGIFATEFCEYVDDVITEIKED